MKTRRFWISLTKVWALAVCSVSVLTVTLLGSCRSKKTVVADGSVVSSVDEQQRLRDMVIQSDSIRKVLDQRSRALMYGPPDLMERRAQENLRMRAQIDSLDAEIERINKKDNR
jgi:hypothetical protein